MGRQRKLDPLLKAAILPIGRANTRRSAGTHPSPLAGEGGPKGRMRGWWRCPI